MLEMVAWNSVHSSVSLVWVVLTKGGKREVSSAASALTVWLPLVVRCLSLLISVMMSGRYISG
jgi:hypothetical protein